MEEALKIERRNSIKAVHIQTLYFNKEKVKIIIIEYVNRQKEMN